MLGSTMPSSTSRRATGATSSRCGPTNEVGIYDGPWGPGRHRPREQPALRRWRERLLPGPEALQAAVLRLAVATSRTAGKAATTSSSASTRSATAATSSRISRSTSSIATTTARSIRSIIYNTPIVADERRELHSGLDQRYVEAQRPPHGQLRRPPRVLQRQWPDQTVAPNGIPALANWPETINRACQSAHCASHRSNGGEPFPNTTTFAPRAGFAYDLTGDNRTVLKVFWGQFRFNSADTLADAAEPCRLARSSATRSTISTAIACWTARRN